MPIIDFHVHLGKSDMYLPWVKDYFGTTDPKRAAEIDHYINPAGMVQLLEENGLDYAVALGEVNPLSTGVVPNEFVAELCKQVKSFIPFGNINPFIATHPEQELERLVKEMGIRGVKLLPSYQYFYPNDPRVYPIYARAQQLGIPVMFHLGSSVFTGVRLKYVDPIHIDDVAVDFPNLKLIMSHSGRGFWYDTAFHMAKVHKNVYMEIAGLPPQNLLSYFPDLEENSDKIIFGSDWPGANIKKNIDAIKRLPLADSTKRKILGDNAVRVLEL